MTTELLTEQKKRRKKWLWGCTGGCLGFMVAVLVLFLALMRFVRQPVPIPPAEAFLTPSTEAFVVVKVDPRDPLMVDIPVQVVRTRALSQKVPTKGGRPLGEDAAQVRGWLAKVIPMQMVVVLEPGEGAVPFNRGAALAIHRYSRFCRFIATSYLEGAAKRGELSLERHEGAAMATTREGGTVAVMGNSFLAADSKATVMQWVDRLAIEEAARKQRGPQPAPEPAVSAELGAARALLDTDQPILFACLNSRGHVLGLLGLMPEGQARNALSAAGLASRSVTSLSGQLKSINSRDAMLTIFLRCSNAAFAAQLREKLERIATTSSEAAPLRETRVALQEETVVRVEARVEDLAQKIAQLLQYMADREKQGG